MLPSHLSADTNRCWDLFFFFRFALLWFILPFTTVIHFLRQGKKEKLLEGFKFSYLQKMIPPFSLLAHPPPTIFQKRMLMSFVRCLSTVFPEITTKLSSLSSGRQIRWVSKEKWLCLVRIIRMSCKGQNGLNHQRHLNHGCRNDSEKYEDVYYNSTSLKKRCL